MMIGVQQNRFATTSPLLLLILLLYVLACARISTCVLVIDTPCGSLKGAISPNANGVYRFLGVPFAETPVRFEKAEQKRSWEGTRDATYYRDSCIQKGLLFNVFGSEDCLTLDVYTPVNLSNVDVNDPSNQIPVMVWIYGGAFVIGNSSTYEGSKMAKLGDVVVVAIQYRLGAFGWLYSYGAKPSNLGLWDQKLALEWIQRNIYAFGGDNSTVTVFGESAGAMSISALITSPLVDNSLFQRAIMESGSVINGDPTQHLKDLAIERLYLLCPKRDVDDRIACLQTLNATEIAEHTSFYTETFDPVPDDQFIMESSSKLLNDFVTKGIDSIQDVIGNLKQYDILSGFNGQEGFLLLKPIADELRLTLDDGIKESIYSIIVLAELETITPNLTVPGKELVCYLQANYNTSLADHPSKDDSNMNNLLDMLGDFVMAMPTINTATIHSEVVRVTNTQKKTYMYLFDHKPANGSLCAVGPDWLQTSASHGDDLPFVMVYNNISDHGCLTKEEEKLSYKMIKYWSNFAKTGNPNFEGSRKWKEYTKETTNFVRLTLDAVTAEVNPRGDKPQLWDCVYKAVYANNPNLCKTPATALDGAGTAIQYKVPVSGDNDIVSVQLLTASDRYYTVDDEFLYSSANHCQATAAAFVSALIALFW